MCTFLLTSPPLMKIFFIVVKLKQYHALKVLKRTNHTLKWAVTIITAERTCFVSGKLPGGFSTGIYVTV